MSDTITARAMHDRVALVRESADMAWVHEMTVEGAALLVTHLVAAIRQARQAEMAG